MAKSRTQKSADLPPEVIERIRRDAQDKTPQHKSYGPACTCGLRREGAPALMTPWGEADVRCFRHER